MTLLASWMAWNRCGVRGMAQRRGRSAPGGVRWPFRGGGGRRRRALWRCDWQGGRRRIWDRGRAFGVRGAVHQDRVWRFAGVISVLRQSRLCLVAVIICCKWVFCSYVQLQCCLEQLLGGRVLYDPQWRLHRSRRWALSHLVLQICHVADMLCSMLYDTANNMSRYFRYFAHVY